MDTLELIKTIDFNNDKKISLSSQLLFLAIAGLGIGIISILRLNENNDLKIVYIVLSCIIYIIFHELTHILFMKLFSKDKILFHFKIPYLAVGSEFYFNRIQFIVIALAPMVLFAIIIFVFFNILPKNYTFLLSVIMTLNFAGSSGDILQIIIISKIKKDIKIQDDGKCTKIYIKTEK